jgi:hypothetical protein
MKTEKRYVAGSRRLPRLRLGGTLAAVTCCLALSALMLGAPAGASTSYRAHGASAAPTQGNATGGAVNPKDRGGSAAAPLTLATFDVTNLATGDTDVSTTAVVAPSTGCAQNQSFICLTTGSDGFFTMTTTTPLQAGQVYSGLEGSATVSVNGTSCGEGGGATNGPTSAFDVELDQFDWTGQSPPFDTFAAQFDCTNSAYDISGSIAYNIVPTDPGDGYYVFGQQGELAGFGNDNYLVYLDGAGNYSLNAPIVGMAPTPDGAGYWMVGSDGGVYASGDAQFYGSTGSLHLNKPIVGMAATPDGKGYWFVGSDGGIFSYGDAQFYGSTGSLHLNKAIVGMAATPSGNGYWLVASDGGIFAYGDAQFYGSTGSLHLNKPVVGMAPTPDGGGYWFVASDGGIFAYGDAGFYGSTGSLKLNEPIVGMTPTPDGSGYWFTASDGGVFNYGSADFDGSLGGTGITDVAGMSLGM